MKSRYGRSLGLAVLVVVGACSSGPQATDITAPASTATDASVPPSTAPSDPSPRPGDPSPTPTVQDVLGLEYYDGAVTFAADDPPWQFADWASSPYMTTILHDGQDEGLSIVGDPVPVGRGCQTSPVPADAEALANSIRSDPDVFATAPVPVRIAGIEGLQMELQAGGATTCEPDNNPLLFSEVSLSSARSYRVYLLDLPGGSPRILAIVIWAPPNASTVW